MRILILIIFLLNINCKEKRDSYSINDKNDIKTLEKDKVINENLQSNQLIDSVFFKLEEVNLPISSEFISNLVIENEGVYNIEEEIVKNKKAFSNELFTEVKSEKKTDDFFYNVTGKEFFPVFKKTNNNYTTVGSLVRYYGENDIQGVFFILSNFNKKGKQIDYLIIYNRFLWEVNYEYNFTIDENFKITIDKKEENFWDEEKDDFIKEGEKPETKQYKESYLVNAKGLFVNV
ncbi:hypothetical protein D1818_07085 [Aquimarina sp. BL5]|uniref:hypothetical protein n=1 Tax=Aquimarina sp. BL5 TaxID=1714860 RepID=UPI000E4F9B6C|nr:hypothetical protein [Aquimarina sp. BL5]AXT50608.1 hypothetical protein D1818_07085 [Aquimarina sp. BL5]RKM91375.1 hypothetical protein D7036_23320 [Aquimarina sp. BL5]